MELAELLAREGHDPNDPSALMSWARTRADALLHGLDPGSPVAALLVGFAQHVAPDSSGDVGDEVDAPEDLRSAVTAATTSSPQPAASPEDDDPDGGLGGFARFGAMVRVSRPYPFRQEAASDERPNLAHSFALAAERANDETPPTPAPSTPAPTSTNDLSSTFPLAALNFSAEESGNLVLGIPDEDSNISGLFDAAIDPDAMSDAPARPATIAADDSTGLLDAGAPSTLATPVSADETIAEPLRRRRDTPPSPGLPAVGAGTDPSAPVLRHARGPKKKVVELGAPLAKPRTGGSGKAVPVTNPKAVSARSPRKAPPPPPPTKKRPPVEEEIEELSRVELIDDLPPYLRDDDE